MTWVFLAILSHLFWGITNIGEKFLIDRHFKNPIVYNLWAFILGGSNILIIFFIDFIWPNVTQLLLLGIASLGFFLGAMFYIKAIQIEEVSRINMLWNLIPIYSVFLAWFFIGESLSITQIVALIILVLSGFVASLHVKFLGKITISRAFILMLIGTLFFSIFGVTLRMVTMNGYPASSAFVISGTYYVLFSVIILIFVKQLRIDFKKESKYFLLPKILGIVFVINIISRIGTILNINAISLGPIALVNALEVSQTIFVFLIALFLSLFFPKIIKEEIDKKNIALKIFAMILMIIGILILNLG